MADLKTTYLGLKLKNPVIIGASNIVKNPDHVKMAEDAGAAAVVYKSLFEEQIQLESAQLSDKLQEYSERSAEMVSLFPGIEHAGPEEHLFNIARLKKSIQIPLIASLNAIIRESWIEYAQKLEGAGADALELNFYSVPRDINLDGSTLVSEQVAILQAVKNTVKIPVSVKLSPFYANPLNLVKRLDEAGADGYVLFNRLFQPDINLEKEEHYSPLNLSVPEDNRLPLRFAGLLYQNVNGNICSNTGIFTGSDVAKMILAGADVVQVVSTLYKNKLGYISTIISDLENWMDKKGYKKLDDFRGLLSDKRINDIFVYKRAQYIDLLLNSDEILVRHPLR